MDWNDLAIKKRYNNWQLYNEGLTEVTDQVKIYVYINVVAELTCGEAYRNLFLSWREKG